MQVTLNVVEGGCWCNDGLQVWVSHKLPFNYWDFYDIADLWPAVTPASKRGRVKFQAWNLNNVKPCAAGAPVLSADTIYESYPFPTTRVISGSDVNLRLKFPGASPKVCMATAPTPPSSAG